MLLNSNDSLVVFCNPGLWRGCKESKVDWLKDAAHNVGPRLHINYCLLAPAGENLEPSLAVLRQHQGQDVVGLRVELP